MATTLGTGAAAHSVEGAPAKRMSTPFLIRKVLDMSNRFSGRKGSLTIQKKGPRQHAIYPWSQGQFLKGFATNFGA